MESRERRLAISSTMMAVCYSFLLFLFSRSLPCLAVSSISSSEPLFPNQTLISPSQIFELGFFTPNGSSNQYIGIWYKNFTLSKIVWVANQDRPLDHKDQLASLTIGGDGNLRLLDGGQNTVWSTNGSSRSTSSVATLQDTGNFMLTEADSGDMVWQSSDFLTDTLLPGMKMGINIKTGEKRYLISWKTEADPSPGNFSVGMTSEIPPQPFTWKGSTPYWRGGQWDKSKFIGISDMERTYLSGYSVQQDIDQGTAYYTFSTNGNSSFMYMFISPEGSFKLMKWVDEERGWQAGWEVPLDRCDTYGTCGPFGVCNSSAPSICGCPDGFGPESEEEWERGNWTGGCRRLKELRCERGLSTGAPSSGSGAGEADWFLKLSQMKLPDTAIYLPLSDPNAGDCLTWCSNNCSCIAYSYVDAIGCLTWSGELMDIQGFNASGEDLFLRLAYDEREKGTDNDENSTGTRRKLIISLTTIAGGSIILGAGMYVMCRGRANKAGIAADTQSNKLLRRTGDEEKDDLSAELPIFDLKSILAATDSFSITNKLGQGGFGPVYKGTLQDGKEVAVKRLSSTSGQGMEEFKNEIVLISKLQHRNLVKLMGCCIEAEEKILVYEYLPNKSLDTFLFDSSRSRELTWEKRFDIIQGIARGLLYLHRDSCLRVIHRDLKASNILLDEQMNPKISDFGLARMFQATQDLVNTRRVVGTLGYMAPEYAMGGMFSEKSDVYSFGVLMLEIISSKRNSSLCYLGETLSLLYYAWQLWREGRWVEFIHEANLADYAASLQEVSKCIQIGLLCIQDQPVDRPNMSSLVLMLSGKLDLPDPKPPSLTSFQSSLGHETPSQQEKTLSVNEMTHTQVEGR